MASTLTVAWSVAGLSLWFAVTALLFAIVASLVVNAVGYLLQIDDQPI